MAHVRTSNRYKRKSITRRLTTFYSIALFLFILALFVFLYTFMNRSTFSLSQPILESAVVEVMNGIEHEGTHVYLDNDVRLFNEGVSLVLYRTDMTVVRGTVPQGFPDGIPLQNDRHRTIDGEVQWNIYDRFYQVDNTGIWVRGIYSMDSANHFLRNTLMTLLMTFPLFILLVVVVGYFITKRTLKPLEGLTQAVATVSDSKDLNKRIPLALAQGGRANEIDILSLNFNDMLDRLQEHFLAEQQFTSDASHELRTPVAAIMSQAGVGLMEGATLEDKNYALQRIQIQSQNMNTLINQLLELTRADRGTLELNFEHIHLSELAEMVWESLLDMAAKRAIRLQKQIDSDIYVTGDEVLLMRLIINLASNGIKYGREGGYVAIDIRRDEAEALISITDNGIGMSEDDMDKIFDRFYRVSKHRGQEKHDDFNYSSGLGLSMVKWIVEVHNGTIQVSSTENLGSQFVVRLPLLYE